LVFENLIMAKGYRRVDRDQPLLLPPDLREWIPDDPVWLVIEIIEQHLDTSAFHAGRRVGGVGREGYDPDMLLALLVWAWMQGVFSSRSIERLCGRDLSFRVICAGDVPDHVTIARFRQGFAAAVEQLFAEVLVVCRRLGLGQLGVVALDGTKIAAPASTDANRTEEGLRRAAQAEQQRQAEREQGRQQARQAAAWHAAQDAKEDARFGEGKGDEMPAVEPPATSGGEAAEQGASGEVSSRARRIAAALADLEAEREQDEAAQLELAARRQARLEAKGGRPVDGRPPAGSEIMLAEQALAEARSEVAERYERWQVSGKGRNPCPGGVEAHHQIRDALARVERARQVVARREARQATKPGWAPVRNITDSQSRLQPRPGGGWVQGYNAQAVATSDGIMLATSVSNSPSDSTAFVGLMQAACAAAEQMGAGPLGTILADAGYLTVDNLTAPGPDRLIAVGRRRDLEQAARNASSPSGNESLEIQMMQDRLKTPDGIAAYRQRGRIIETVFGHGKHNWNFRRFTGCGLQRAQAEWAFHGAVHNIAKIITQLAAQPTRRTSG
jgi:transposase